MINLRTIESSYGHSLERAELAALNMILSAQSETVAQHELITARGRLTTHCDILVDGLACSYTVLPTGVDHISRVFLPGDVCSLDAVFDRPSLLDVAAVVPSSVVRIPRTKLRDLLFGSAAIGAAVCEQLTIMSSLSASRAIALDQTNNGKARLLNFLGELYLRFRGSGQADGDQFHLPLPLVEVSGSLNMSVAQVSGAVQALNDGSLVSWVRQTVQVKDPVRLRSVIGVDWLRF